MADATKGWHAVFDKGTKQAQEKLKKAHGHKPEFQAFLKSRGAEGGERSAKQATTSLKKATDTKIAAQKIADMRFKKALQASSDRVREMGRRRRESGEGLGGGLETAKDVVAHIKKYGSIKAGRLGEAMDRTQLIGKVAKDAEKKKAAMKIVDRLRSASYGRGAGLNPSKDMKLNPSSPLKTDMSALSHKRHSMNYEEVQIDEVSKKEAEAALGGPVKDKPKGPAGKLPLGFRMARSAARKAMKGQVDAVHRSMEKTMKKEEVEQVVEQDDSMEKKEMAQTQLHFMAYAAKEILEFIDMGGEIEEWYQNKLSKVQSEVESLHSYIEGEKRRTGMVKEEEQIDEKINLAKAKMGDVVKDFYKSKAPQFKGKSMAKRREMAVAAKLGAEREAGMREEVEQVDEVKAVKAYDKEGKLVGRYRSMDHAKQMKPGHTYKVEEEVVTEAEGTVAVTPKEKALAAHHGDPKKITYGDVIKARLKSAAAKKMGK